MYGSCVELELASLTWDSLEMKKMESVEEEKWVLDDIDPCQFIDCLHALAKHDRG